MRVDFTQDADGSFASAKLTGPADFVFDGVISLYPSPHHVIRRSPHRARHSIS
jgi:hypothetical protein